MTLYMHLLCALFLTTTAIANQKTFIPPVDCKNNVITCFIAKVESTKDQSFYGTALLYKVTDEYFYFITNDHVLPENKQWLESLVLRSPLNYYEKTSILVIGREPGKDVALFAIKRGGKDVYTDSEKPFAVHPENYFSKKTLVGTKARLLLLGVPGSARTAHEVRPAASGQIFIDAAITDPTNNFSREIPLTAQPYCPAPLLDECIALPMLSFGFSGAALLAIRNGNRIPEIAGIISHFTPMAPYTYVIPMREAASAASRILGVYQKQDKKSAITLKNDDGELFAYVGKDRLKFLNGTFTNADVFRRSSIVGGGGITSGGGGDPSEGGGITSGGGNDPLSSLVAINKLQDVAYIDSFEKIQNEVRNPQHWSASANLLRLFSLLRSFKGISAWLNYKPGLIFQQDGTKTAFVGWGEHSIRSISEFRRLYIKFPDEVFRSMIIASSFPEDLRSFDGSMGLHAFSTIRRFKSPAEFRSMKTFDSNDTGFESLANDLGPLISAHAKNSGDLIIGQQGDRYFRAINKAKFTSNSISLGDEVTLSFTNPWIQEGDKFFRTAGGVSIDLDGLSIRLSTDKANAWPGYMNATLEYDETLAAWELKIMLLFNPPKEFVASGTFLSQDQIQIHTFYMPLKTATH